MEQICKILISFILSKPKIWVVSWSKLILLNPKEKCIIYDLFLIVVIVKQFSDTTCDLIIKLISYYYDEAKELRELLGKLISIKLTISEF